MNAQYQDIIPPGQSPRKRSIRDIPLRPDRESQKTSEDRYISNSMSESDNEASSARRAAPAKRPVRKILKRDEPKQVEVAIKQERSRNSLSADVPIVLSRPSKSSVERYEEEYVSERKASSGGIFSRNKTVWIIAVIAVVGAFFAFSTLFASASVKIYSKKAMTTFNDDKITLALSTPTTLPTGTSTSSIVFATTTKSASTSTKVSTTTVPVAVVASNIPKVSYNIMTISVSASTSTSPTSSTGSTKPAAPVSAKAIGTVIIYNNYNTSPQTLIATTRLASPSGLIYRLDNDVTVPGQTTVAGKVVPGSVSVNVTADQYGSAYNAPLEDFTIVGFKGTAKYTGFYGRSKTTMTGGAGATASSTTSTTASGSKTASTSAQTAQNNAAIAAIKATLGSQIRDQVNAQLPPGFSYIPGSALVVYDAPQIISGANGSSIVSEKALAYAVIVNTEELQAALRTVAWNNDATLSATFGDSATATTPTIFDLSGLTADLPSSVTTSSISSASLILTINGTSSIQSILNPTTIAQAISTLSRSKALLVLKNRSGIDDASISLRPWWKTSLPSTSKIHIEIDPAK